VAVDCPTNIINPKWMATLTDDPDVADCGIVNHTNFQQRG
jgi:hypothetical protein